MTRTTRGGADDARRLTPSGDIWTRRSARRADTTAAIGTPITTSMTSSPVEREVAWGERRSREGTWTSSGRNSEEEREADRHSRERGDRRLHRRDHRDLARRGADEAHGGEALLSPGGGQPAGGRDQDEHGQQQGDRSTGQDPLQDRSAPGAALAVVAVARGPLDASDLDRPGHLRELAARVADDDDERVRGRKSRCADGADLVPREPVASSFAGTDAERGECRRGVELPRSGQVRDARRDRCARSGGGDVDPVDRLAAELVDAGQPPQPVGRRGARGDGLGTTAAAGAVAECRATRRGRSGRSAR